MNLLHTTENRINAVEIYAGLRRRAVRILSVSLLILSASWITSEARACDLCGFQECWFIEETAVMSKDSPVGLRDREQDGTILRDDHGAHGDLSLEDVLFLIDLLADSDDHTEVLFAGFNLFAERRKDSLALPKNVDRPVGRVVDALGRRVQQAGAVQPDRGIVVGNPADTLLDRGGSPFPGDEEALSRKTSRTRPRR